MSLTRSFFEDPFFADPFFSTGAGFGQQFPRSDVWNALQGPRINVPLSRSDLYEQTASSTIAPPMDIVETENKICYHFDMPGIHNKESINLNLDNNILKVDCD